MIRKSFLGPNKIFPQKATCRFFSRFSFKQSSFGFSNRLKPLSLFTFLTGGFFTSNYLLKTEEELQDVDVGDVNDIQEGQMKEVKVGTGEHDSVLIANVEGKLYCVSSRCTHFGVALSKGVLIDDKVVCPLHSAAFSVVTGYPEVGPVIDGLHTYEIKVENDRIIVRVPKTIPLGKPVKMTKRDPNDKRTYVVVGGGVAGLNCAETLRQSGFTGEIVMVSGEKELPYDRTLLTKKVKLNMDKLRLRSQEFFDSNDIKFIGGAHVTKIDPGKKEIVMENGESLFYDKICIASGTRPIRNEKFIPGSHLKNVTTIRDFVDIEKLKKSVKDGAKEIVVAGGSFIGMEAGASIKEAFKDSVNVRVIVPEIEPYFKTLGPEIGSFMRKLAEKIGVNITLNTFVRSIKEKGSQREVELSDGTKLAADFVVLGIGVEPNSEFARDVLPMDKDGGISGDAFLKVGDSGDIYCAGDVCSFPYFASGQRIRVTHYSDAMNQGVVAAWNMLGKMVPIATVPFFWTRLCNVSIRYSGWATSWDKIHVDGSIESGKFVAYYIKGDKILAVAETGRANDTVMLSQAFKMGFIPSASDLVSGKTTLEDIKKKVQENRKQCKCMRQRRNDETSYY